MEGEEKLVGHKADPWVCAYPAPSEEFMKAVAKKMISCYFNPKGGEFGLFSGHIPKPDNWPDDEFQKPSA
eukprot:g32008.t1